MTMQQQTSETGITLREGRTAMKTKHIQNMLRTALIAATVMTMPALPGMTGITTASAESVIRVGENGGRTERIVLGLDKSIVLDLPADANDILVANPEVADAVTRTARRIYLFGKEIGTTNIFVFDKNGRQIVSLDLQVERDVAGLDRYLERFIPNSDIKTEIINDNIVLTGRVQTPQESAKAEKLAEIFVKGGDATTQTRDSFFTSTGDSQIVNLLEITGGDQVTVKVTVAEVQRSVVKQLGINLVAGREGGNGITFSAVNQGSSGALGKGVSTVSRAMLGGTIGGLDIEAHLQAMERAGVMKTLASPTLTTVSGEKAVFKAGGEYNIIDEVESDEDGVAYGIERVEYGVGLEFTPVVLSPGRISLKVRTSVSEPTVEQSIPMEISSEGGSSANILSLRKRLADTTVELPSGGSMVIAGLIRDDVRSVVTGFPGLSKVPVIGALFRSRDFVRNETELIIIATPYLVRPVAESQLRLPTDGLDFASDGSTVLLGRVNRIYGSTKTNKPDGRYHGSVGFILK
jgi:pilus assembly protein CpaC